MDSFQPYPSCHITFKNQSLLQWQIILWKIKRKHKYPFLILYFYILHPQLKSPGNSCALECPQGSERLSCTTSCIRWYAQRSMELSPSTMGWEHCHHNCLEAFSAELKFLPLNFLWCMDHGLFKLTQTVEAMTQGWGTDCLQWHCIFFPQHLQWTSRDTDDYDSRKKVSWDIRLGWRPQGRWNAGHIWWGTQ